MTTLIPAGLKLPVGVDSTMISCFRQCPNKYFREFVQGFRPPGVSIDLHAGGCFATALEVTYKAVWEQNLSLQEAIECGHAAFLVAWGNFEIPEFKKTAKTKDRMWEAVLDYFATYPPKTDIVQPYFAADGKPTFEYTFAIPLEPFCNPADLDTKVIGSNGEQVLMFPEHPDGGPFLYTGRFDMLGSHIHRKVPIIRDEKTSGKTPGQNWAEQWDLRSQFIGYTWACRQAGIPVDTVIVRNITILKGSINSDISAEKMYTDFMRERWHEQLRRDLWRLRRSWDEGYFDFNLGDACTQFGNCVFQRVCQSPNPDSWLNEFVVRRWNPLDKNPAKDEGSAA